MFCPNCGKDCQDFKFCPGCGYDLQKIAVDSQQEAIDALSFEERRKALENAGNPYCPKCLSVNIVSKEEEPPSKDYLLYRNPYAHLVGNILHLILDINYRKEKKKGPRNECLDCGCWWYPKLQGLVKRYRPYLEELIGDNEYVVFTGEGGKMLTLEWNRLTIDSPDEPEKSVLHPYEIWYWNLHSTRQKFHKALTYEPEPRWLTISDKKHKRWPGPGTPELASTDPYTVLFEKSQIEKLTKIKAALNGIIEENKKAGLL